ncbi:hypothetical protein [Spirosoma migulaei]
MSTERMELLAKVKKGKTSSKISQKALGLLAGANAVERYTERGIAATYPLLGS